jgi:hypothetical protein
MSGKLTKDDVSIWGLITRSVNKLRGAPASVSTGPIVLVAPTPAVEHFEPVLDLHGYNIHQAFAIARKHLAKARSLGVRRVTVITGKSGEMNREFPHWFSDRPEISRITAKNGGGAWDLWLKRPTSTPKT